MENEVEYTKIGDRVRYERETFGITREKFSEMLDLSSYYIGQIERGERKMSIETLINVSECLHISIDYLIYGIRNTQNEYDSLNLLISRCSQKEARIIEEVVKIILPHIKR